MIRGLLLLLVACGPGGGGPVTGVTDGTDGGHETGDQRPPFSISTATGQPVTGGDTAPIPHHHTGDTAGVPVEVEPTVPDVVVDCSGNGDFTTIQAAIDASVSGQHIGVQPCTYPERIDFKGHSVDVFGIDGSATTILDGGGAGPIVTVTRGESDGTRLAGFTLTNGRNSDGPSAIEVQLSYIDLQDLVITGNDPSDYTIYTNGAIVTLADSTVSGNAFDGGDDAAIYLDTGAFVMTGSTVDCDSGDYALFSHNATIVLDSWLHCTGGAAVWVDGGEIHLRRSHAEGTGDVAVHAEDNPDNTSEKVHIVNSEIIGGQQGLYAEYMNILIENSTLVATREAADLDQCRPDGTLHDSIFFGGQCDLRGDGTPFLVTWNAIANQGNCGLDGLYDMTLDPLFVAYPTDLHLQVGSPAIDAGDPDGDYNDPDGTRNDLGRYGGNEAFGPP